MDNDFPTPDAEEALPAAPLTAIPLRRGGPESAPTSKKAGDITQQLAGGRPRPQLAVATPDGAAVSTAEVSIFRHLPQDAAARLEAFSRDGGGQPAAGLPPELRQPAYRESAAPTELSIYWRELKNGRRFPARADLDAAYIARHWPNAMLLICEAGGQQLRPDAIFSETLRAAKRQAPPGAAEVVDYTTMVVEWVLGIGRTVARLGRPVHDSRPFSTARGEVRYRALALPLGEDRAAVDHVLCNVTHAP